MTAPDGVPGLNEAEQIAREALLAIPGTTARFPESVAKTIVGNVYPVIAARVRAATLDEAEKTVMSHADVADPDKEPGMRLAARDIRDLRVRALRTEGQ